MLAERRVASEALGVCVCAQEEKRQYVCERASASREGEGWGKVSNHTETNKTRRFPGLDLLWQEPRGRTEPPGARRNAAHVRARVLFRFLQDHGVLEEFPCLRSLSLTLLRGTIENEKEEISQRLQVNF